MILWNVEDYLRLRTGGDDEGLALFAERHVRPGTQVLELGCGPGRAAAALAQRHGASVTAVDASPEMLAAARELVPPAVQVVEARAEALPFADGAFDAVLAQFVVHLLDRPVAFRELHRVLRPDGVLWLKTSDPDRIEDHWLARPFPSVPAIERARFPDEARLRSDLEGAGFEPAFERREVGRHLSKAEALERMRTRSYSTVALLDDDEREAGIAWAERELEDPVEYDLTLLFVEARRAESPRP